MSNVRLIVRWLLVFCLVVEVGIPSFSERPRGLGDGPQERQALAPWMASATTFGDARNARSHHRWVRAFLPLWSDPLLETAGGIARPWHEAEFPVESVVFSESLGPVSPLADSFAQKGFDAKHFLKGVAPLSEKTGDRPRHFLALLQDWFTVTMGFEESAGLAAKRDQIAPYNRWNEGRRPGWGWLTGFQRFPEVLMDLIVLRAERARLHPRTRLRPWPVTITPMVIRWLENPVLKFHGLGLSYEVLELLVQATWDKPWVLEVALEGLVHRNWERRNLEGLSIRIAEGLPLLVKVSGGNQELLKTLFNQLLDLPFNPANVSAEDRRPLPALAYALALAFINNPDLHWLLEGVYRCGGFSEAVYSRLELIGVRRLGRRLGWVHAGMNFDERVRYALVRVFPKAFEETLARPSIGNEMKIEISASAAKITRLRTFLDQPILPVRNLFELLTSLEALRWGRPGFTLRLLRGIRNGSIALWVISPHKDGGTHIERWSDENREFGPGSRLVFDQTPTPVNGSNKATHGPIAHIDWGASAERELGIPVPPSGRGSDERHLLGRIGSMFDVRRAGELPGHSAGATTPARVDPAYIREQHRLILERLAGLPPSSAQRLPNLSGVQLFGTNRVPQIPDGVEIRSAQSVARLIELRAGQSVLINLNPDNGFIGCRLANVAKSPAIILRGIHEGQRFLLAVRANTSAELEEAFRIALEKAGISGDIQSPSVFLLGYDAKGDGKKDSILPILRRLVIHDQPPPTAHVKPHWMTSSDADDFLVSPMVAQLRPRTRAGNLANRESTQYLWPNHSPMSHSREEQNSQNGMLEVLGGIISGKKASEESFVFSDSVFRYTVECTGWNFYVLVHLLNQDLQYVFIFNKNASIWIGAQRFMSVRGKVAQPTDELLLGKIRNLPSGKIARKTVQLPPDSNSLAAWEKAIPLFQSFIESVLASRGKKTNEVDALMAGFHAIQFKGKKVARLGHAGIRPFLRIYFPDISLSEEFNSIVDFFYDHLAGGNKRAPKILQARQQTSFPGPLTAGIRWGASPEEELGIPMPPTGRGSDDQRLLRRIGSALDAKRVGELAAPGTGATTSTHSGARTDPQTAKLLDFYRRYQTGEIRSDGGRSIDGYIASLNVLNLSDSQRTRCMHLTQELLAVLGYSGWGYPDIVLTFFGEMHQITAQIEDIQKGGELFEKILQMFVAMARHPRPLAPSIKGILDLLQRNKRHSDFLRQVLRVGIVVAQYPDAAVHPGQILAIAFPEGIVDTPRICSRWMTRARKILDSGRHPSVLLSAA